MISYRRAWLGAVLTGGLATLSFVPRIYAASNIPAVPQYSLALVHSGQIGSGNTVQFQVSSVGQTAHDMLYQFWLQTQKGWSMIQDYSPDSVVHVPLSPGSYIMAVYSLTPSQLKQGQWNQAEVTTSVVNVESQVHLTASGTGTQEQGMTVKASATNLIDPVYQFWIESPTGHWTSSGGYQSLNTFRYVPPMAGTYRVIAYAKDMGAPNNGKDSVWTQVHQIQIAPAQAPVAAVTTHLMNPLPALNNSHALLLGQTAFVSASVEDAQGNPVADVPVEFTLTNDSNPADHVSLPEGLNGRATTNAEGTADSVLTLTNPENGHAATLAANSGAIARITYQVTVPSAPGVVATNDVLFAAVNESGTVVTNATGPVEGTESLGRQIYHLQYAFSENIDLLGGKPLSLAMPSTFILPAASSGTSTTLTLDDTSQAFGPLETWTPGPITIPEGFSRATLKLDQLDLSRGSVFQLTYTPRNGGTPYVRTISGPVAESSAGIQIPAQMTGGTVSFRLSAPSLINPRTALGVKIASLSWQTLSGSVVRIPVPSSDVLWQDEPVTYTAPEALSTTQAQNYLGSYYRTGASYDVTLPLYPQVGDALISEVMNDHTVSDFLVPSMNNGNNQNVLAYPGTVVPVAPAAMNNLPPVHFGSGQSVSATRTGSAEFVGHLHIPGTDIAWPLMHSYAAFVPQASGQSSSPSSWALSGQRIVVTAQVKDSFGNPAPLGTPVHWSLPSAPVEVLSQDNSTNGQGQAQLVLVANTSADGTLSAQSAGYQVTLADKTAQGTSLSLKWLPLHFAFQSGAGQTYATSSAQAIMPVPTQILNPSQSYDLGIRVMAGTHPLSGYAVEMDNGQGVKKSVSANSQGIAAWAITAAQNPSQTWTVKSVSSANTQDASLMMDGSLDAGSGSVAGLPELKIPLLWQQQTEPALGWNPLPPQMAAVGAQAPFTVLALDSNGNPLANDPVSFSLLGQETASLSTGTVTTNAQGLAQVWVSGGQGGETDTLEVQSPKTSGVLSTPLTWTTPPGPSEMVPLAVTLNALAQPNVLTLTFSRNVDPQSVLADGSQFLVTSPQKGIAYQITSAQVKGTQVALTLAASNPDIPGENGVQVSVSSVTQDGIKSAVSDNYQQTAQTNPVTVFAPSAPQIAASAQNGTLDIQVSNHGSPIPSGQSVVIMPSQASGSVAGLAGGAPDVLSTSTVETSDSWKIPYKDQGSASVTYTVSFDGKTISVLG